MMLVVMVKMKMIHWCFLGTRLAGSSGLLLEDDVDGDNDYATWLCYDWSIHKYFNSNKDVAFCEDNHAQERGHSQ